MGELYGRALVVIAAEQYAARLMLPTSQRRPATAWASHKDLAAKPLRKLAGPHVPESLTQLQRAVKRAYSACEKTERELREQRSADASLPAVEPTDSGDAVQVDVAGESAGGGGSRRPGYRLMIAPWRVRRGAAPGRRDRAD